MATMHMSDEGLRFLIAREGRVSSMYNDNAGHCTIGVGHLVHHGPTEFGTVASRTRHLEKADPHDGMTPQQAQHWDLEKPFFASLNSEQLLELLHNDIQGFEATVNESVQVALSQWQFDALVSFSFNVGGANFRHSTLLTLVNRGDWAGAAAEFDRWVKSNRKVNPGLVNRRAYEKRLFANGDYAAHEHTASAHLKRPDRHYRNKHHHLHRRKHGHGNRHQPIQYLG